MKEADDITILVEQHAKEIWALKQELVRMKKRTQEVEKSRPLNTMDEVAYRELRRENEELKKESKLMNDTIPNYTPSLKKKIIHVGN